VHPLLTLACVSFFQVFTLGFQSRSVNAGNYVYAFFCSSVIGFSQVYVWKHIMTGDQSLLSTAVYAFSGGLAIMSAIFVHKHMHKGKK
jgi:hypothetical protein